MATFSRDITGLLIWMMRDYMLELGGSLQSDGTILGEGWRGRLTQLDDYQIGSLRVGRIRVEIEGNDDAVAALLVQLEPKLVRAGG